MSKEIKSDIKKLKLIGKNNYRTSKNSKNYRKTSAFLLFFAVLYFV